MTLHRPELMIAPEQIAAAVVAASKLLGCDPMLIDSPAIKGPNIVGRLRWLTLTGLKEAFPLTPKRWIGEWINFDSHHNVTRYRPDWWEPGWTEIVADAALKVSTTCSATISSSSSSTISTTISGSQPASTPRPKFCWPERNEKRPS